MTPTLELRNVVAGYGATEVLHVNLVVQAGGVTALLGANGAGKTRTLRAISNLAAEAQREPDRGVGCRPRARRARHRQRAQRAGEPRGRRRAQDALFSRLRDMAHAGWERLPTAARVAADLPSGRELLALRDAGNELISQLIEASASGKAGQLIDAYLRAELDMEMRHTPKPMFAEMSSGKAQPPG